MYKLLFYYFSSEVSKVGSDGHHRLQSGPMMVTCNIFKCKSKTESAAADDKA